jgi:predicted DCC family thiol-disulfide oxidoreductase YuxK
MQKENHTVYYDGECGLCAWSVRFIRRRDKKRIFNYIPLQSEEAILPVEPGNLPALDPDTVIYKQNGRFYYRSEAAIRILMKLGGFYRLSAIFLIVPQRIRDYFYDLIAKNRHKWFKANDSCSIDLSE